jgi:SOS-response transcriptional repressor LexA
MNKPLLNFGQAENLPLINSRQIFDRIQSAFKGESQAHIAEKLEISDPAISAWKTRGKTPSLETLVKVSELTNVSLHWLITGKAEPSDVVNGKGITHEDGVVEHFQFDEILTEYIEEYANQQGFDFNRAVTELVSEALETHGILSRTPDDLPNVIPAGGAFQAWIVGIIAAGEPIETLEKMEPIWLPEIYRRPNVTCLRVRGDSMSEHDIFDGDVIIVQREVTPVNGQIVAAVVDGEGATLKKWRRSGRQVQLIPGNPKYQTKIYDIERVEVYGVMLGFLRHQDR